MALKPLALLVAAAALSGCSIYREATSATLDPGRSWRATATEADRDRLRNWRKAWDAALEKVRAAEPGAIAAEPELFDPDRALQGAPPPGNYRCRTFKLGAAGTGTRDFTAWPWLQCRITAEGGDVLRFEKLTGTQRAMGLLFPESSSRHIFLGTLVLGDETSPLRYGTDRNRDMAGYLDRIGEARWRLVLPNPRFESVLDVVELVPAQ